MESIIRIGNSHPSQLFALFTLFPLLPLSTQNLREKRKVLERRPGELKQKQKKKMAKNPKAKLKKKRKRRMMQRVLTFLSRRPQSLSGIGYAYSIRHVIAVLIFLIAHLACSDCVCICLCIFECVFCLFSLFFLTLRICF